MKVREVVMIDIANDPIQSTDYKPFEDPTKFKSQKTERGPLVGKWQDSVSLTWAKLFLNGPAMIEVLSHYRLIRL